MKTLKYLYYLLPVLGLIFLSSCEDDDMKATDSMLNFEIEEVPATEDYLLGVMYYSLNEWNDLFYEEPVIGRYGEGLAVSDTTAMEQHIAFASDYDINFFMFDFNPSFDSLGILITDSATSAGIFVTRPNASLMNFALKFNFGYLGLGSNFRLNVNDTLFDDFIDGFKMMIPYFEKANYQKIDNRYVVYMSNANDLYSDSTGNIPVYTELRARMQQEGYDLYIIGEQPRWTPPARYEIRLRGCVDAVTMKDMILTTNYETSQFFHQYIYLNWEYAMDFYANWGADFIPQIQPGFTDEVLNPSSGVFEFDGSEDFFRKYCNVAKKFSPDNRLILIDSFNNWIHNTQIEPSVNKSTMYLDIIKDEFKVD